MRDNERRSDGRKVTGIQRFLTRSRGRIHTTCTNLTCFARHRARSAEITETRWLQTAARVNSLPAFLDSEQRNPRS
jgi:hypothetical protein